MKRRVRFSQIAISDNSGVFSLFALDSEGYIWKRGLKADNWERLNYPEIEDVKYCEHSGVRLNDPQLEER